MTLPNDVAAVICHYASLGVVRVDDFGGAGGLSGARFWRVESPQGPLCLRQWPAEHPTRERLAFIHVVLDFASRNGFDRLPVPIHTLRGETFVEHAGHRWELTAWLPGAGDYATNANRERLRSALAALARFHQATAEFPIGREKVAPSPGVERRKERFELLLGCELAQLERSIVSTLWPDFAMRARECCQLVTRTIGYVANETWDAGHFVVPQQPCICDIWNDNVLFTGNEVSGLVDFGAMRVDDVAIDVARLLGSMAMDDANAWADGLQAYENIRPLSDVERQLVHVFDRANVTISGLNWIGWICRDRRKFERPEAVLGRMDHILSRLRYLATHGI
jgi:homoserine kinase type II